MIILGISAYYHDSAACLLRDGEIVAAAQEERFSRKKHDHRFPSEASAWCLAEAGIDASALDQAAVLTVDGVGEWATTTWGVGRGRRLELMAEVRFPHSLGLLYSAFT